MMDVSRITTTSFAAKSNRRQRSNINQKSFESKDGKMIINEEEAVIMGSTGSDSRKRRAADNDGDDDDDAEDQDHYKNALTSETAFTRNRDGGIKFIKTDKTPTSGTRWNAGSSGAGSSGGGKSGKPNTISQSQKDSMTGARYASKRASGDVKRAGMADPHAYIPLSAAKMLTGKS
jgi:ribosomal RNA-processing protein 12